MGLVASEHLIAIVATWQDLAGDLETPLTAETPLMEAGIDSLAATELTSQLADLAASPLTPTLMFEQPTPRAIAAHILEITELAMGSQGEASPRTPRTPHTPRTPRTPRTQAATVRSVSGQLVVMLTQGLVKGWRTWKWWAGYRNYHLQLLEHAMHHMAQSDLIRGLEAWELWYHSRRHYRHCLGHALGAFGRRTILIGFTAWQQYSKQAKHRARIKRYARTQGCLSA